MAEHGEDEPRGEDQGGGRGGAMGGGGAENEAERGDVPWALAVKRWLPIVCLVGVVALVYVSLKHNQRIKVLEEDVHSLRVGIPEQAAKGAEKAVDTLVSIWPWPLRLLPRIW